MKHTLCLVSCLFLSIFSSIDIFACDGQSDPKNITLYFYDGKELNAQMAFRTFAFDVAALNKILKLMNGTEKELLLKISQLVVSFIEKNGDQNLQAMYDNNVSMAEQARYNGDYMRYITIATLIALYDPSITLKKILIMVYRFTSKI